MKDYNPKGKKVLIMGLGVHGGGAGAARFFARRGAEVLVTDLKKESELTESLKKLQEFHIQYVLGEHREKDFKNADIIIKNPAVPESSKFLKIAKEAGVKIETDVGIFFELFKGKIVGVTGTKGKTTIATLIYEIFKKADIKALIAGNIRVSVLDVLEAAKKEDIAVLELSSWQLEGLSSHKKSPHIAVVSNVMLDHLDRYPSFDDYVAAKEIIFHFQGKNDFLVLNFDDASCRKMAKKINSKVFWYSEKDRIERGVFIDGEKVFFVQSQREETSRPIISLGDIKLFGAHNIKNVLAAIAVAKILGIKDEDIKDAVSNFRGVSFRLELVKEKNGIKYYNDSAATNPAAAMAALNSFSNKISLIAGGTDKNLEFEDFAAKITERTKRIVLFEGTATSKLEPLIRRNLKKEIPIFVANNMKDAVKKASENLEKGDAVLLSPGAASFGLFKNEFDRGEQFNKEIKKL